MNNKKANNVVCPICDSKNADELFSWKNVPANIAILWGSKEDARHCKKGDLKISCCDRCGHVWNTAFDPDLMEYSQAYDNNLHYSETYSQYARKTVKHLIDRYNINGKKIVEIGCGKGDFLILLCTMADNYGIGFDASFEARELDASVSGKIKIVQDFYGEKYADVKGDLVASRYVLEHIENPVEFMEIIRRSIGDRQDVIVYFEVPDVYLILEQLSVWDLIYEHVSFFSPASLATLFEKCGFRVRDIYETFNGQFIGIEASPVVGITPEKYDIASDLNRMQRNKAGFMQNIKEKQDAFGALLERIRNEKLKVLLWGAGAKGVSYLNMLGIVDEIKYVVDINPNKHGKFIAGTGQEIVPPEFAKNYQPDLVIIMNPVYSQEIRNKMTEMNVQAEYLNVV